MAELCIRLFGGFEITREGEPVAGFASDKVRALLAYLVVESDRPHRRETLAGLLWPEYPEPSARASLRRALANLRDVLGDRQAPSPLLSTSRQTVRFNVSEAIWCDVTAFAGALKAPQDPPTAAEHLEAAVELYRGPFLEGFSLGDSVAFEEWVLLRRERLRHDALAAMRRLAAYHGARGEIRRALPYARRQVELEPWREEGQRQLMRLLALEGQRGLAVAQYEACQRTLADQLGVEPAIETTLLCEQIREGAIGQSGAPNRVDRDTAGVAGYAGPARVPGRTRTSEWTARGRLLWIGGALLLLVVAALQLLTFFKIALQTRDDLPPANVVESGGGKLVLPCEDVRPSQICVYAFGTDQRTQLTDDLRFEAIDDLAWSPDGTEIVFVARTGRSAASPESWHIYALSIDGSDLRQLTDTTLSDHVPRWSPDGEWIAFNRSQELWLMRPDGSEQHRLFGESGVFCIGELNWAPGGERIAFLGQPCPPAPVLPNGQVWIINRDGTAPRAVHTFERPPDLASVHWGPDGLEIVCDHTYAEAGPGLLHIDPTGAGEPFPIAVLPVAWRPDYWPRWGRAGRGTNP